MPVERCGRSLFTTTLSVIQDSIMEGLHRTRVPKKKKYVIVPAEGAECDGIQDSFLLLAQLESAKQQ